MATAFNTQVGEGEYRLQFETDHKEHYLFMQKMARRCVDGETMEWISVEERLPDLIPCNAGTAYSEAVIIWTSGRKAMIGVWDGEDFLCAADYWDAEGERVTHWMPLPPPPEQRAEEQLEDNA